MAFLWNRTPQTAIRADAERSAQIDDYVSSRIQVDGPGLALAVVLSGTAVHAAGYGLADIRRGLPIEQDTIFHLASCGKQFTGLGILMLAEERRLHLDDALGEHLPGLAGFGPNVTIRRLLHYTSAIRDLYDEEGVEEVLARCAWPINADIISTYSDLGCPMAEPRIEPGDTFSYSNSGYELLGAIIERVSGRSYNDFFQARVFSRLGMQDSFSIPERRVRDRRRATGYVLNEHAEFIEQGGNEFDDLVGSGSFYTTTYDLCLYDQALRTTSLVSQASMREALTSDQTNDGNDTHYGFGWYLGAYEGMPCADHQGAWIGFYSRAPLARRQVTAAHAVETSRLQVGSRIQTRTALSSLRCTRVARVLWQSMKPGLNVARGGRCRAAPQAFGDMRVARFFGLIRMAIRTH